MAKPVRHQVPQPDRAAAGSEPRRQTLVIDELPMLVELPDVYWTPEGKWATQATLAVLALGGAAFSGIPIWRGLQAELTER